MRVARYGCCVDGYARRALRPAWLCMTSRAGRLPCRRERLCVSPDTCRLGAAAGGGGALQHGRGRMEHACDVGSQRAGGGSAPSGWKRTAGRRLRGCALHSPVPGPSARHVHVLWRRRRRLLEPRAAKTRDAHRPGEETLRARSGMIYLVISIYTYRGGPGSAYRRRVGISLTGRTSGYPSRIELQARSAGACVR